MMNKLTLTICLLILLIPAANADNMISRSQALQCIQLDKDIRLTKQKTLRHLNTKTNLKSKIDYLQNEINQRRRLIEDLDQKHTQINNDNYNKLIIQFENLLEEHKQSIENYNDENDLHKTDNTHAIQLQQTYSDACLNGIQITEELHKDICSREQSEWCGLFKF